MSFQLDAAWVQSFIERHAKGGELDEEVLLREQRRLPPEKSLSLRHSPEIARLCFGVEKLGELDAAYYFWDTTTLSFKAPLLEYVRDGMRVLEIGPGPAATLSLYLARRRARLSQVCAEIDPRFLASARQAALRNGASIEIVRSDMVAGVEGTFDLVFMNPPYMPARTLAGMEIAEGSGESQAGHGGDQGLDVARRFVTEVPPVLREGGVALLGINTRHVPDHEMRALFAGPGLALRRPAYRPEDALPEGLHSQVYVLERR